MQSVRWRLTPLQFDFVWEGLAAGELPYPFELRSHGQDDVERSHLRRQAALELRSMGLTRGDDLDLELKDAVAGLVRSDYVLDSVWLPVEAPGTSPVRVIAARTGRRATLAVQLPGDTEHTGGDLLLTDVPADAMVPAVVAELPPAPPGRHSALSVPVLQQSQHDYDGSVMVDATQGYDRASRERQAVEQLTSSRKTRVGELGATFRDQQGRRTRSGVLRWFDNVDDGRYLMVNERDYGGDRVVVQPADANAIGQRLHNLR
jgi:hypothetical protein